MSVDEVIYEDGVVTLVRTVYDTDEWFVMHDPRCRGDSPGWPDHQQLVASIRAILETLIGGVS